LSHIGVHHTECECQGEEGEGGLVVILDGSICRI
jgi:hypothetical protein